MLTFETYWPALLAVLLIPYLWFVRQRTLTDFAADHLRVATLVRSALVAVLALTLMQPVWSRTGNWVSAVFLLDVSQSVDATALTSAIDWIETTNATHRPNHARFIPFAASSQVFDEVGGLRAVRVSDGPGEGAIDQTITNLQEAIDVAMGSFAPHHLKRMVLISDGNENEGEIRKSIARLQNEGIQVHTIALSSRYGPDVWIDQVRTPGRVTDGELFPLETNVYSQSAVSGVVRVRVGDEVLETRDVNLVPGLNRLAFEIRLSETGPVNIVAEVEVEGDAVADNNAFIESIAVAGKPRILYVEGRPESAHYLEDVLVREGIDVEVRDPQDIPSSVEEFDVFDAIVLSDIRADSIRPAQMDALGTYVRDLGGGLIFAGGDSVFGEDGYSETVVEEILPVRFDLEREPPTVAMIIVLDKSGSMGGSKLELAKEASKAAVVVLKDDHLIGLVAFDYNHYWPFRLTPAAEREEINQNISTIVAGGETNIYPALREAYEELLGVDAEIRHVILLSDGRSLPDDFATLVEEMAAADQTVSTVAVGNGADRELLNQIATWGNGRDYFIEDAARVPQIFTEETELATQGTLSERPFQVTVAKDVEAFSGIDFGQSPPLLGYVSTLLKDTAELLLESDEDEPKPVLARWQYGLGKTIAFTSDVKDRWSAEWLTWEGYGQFWPQLVRETMRRGDNGEIDMLVEKRPDGKAHLTIRALREDGSYRDDLDATVTVVDPTGDVVDLSLHHSGPGFYEATYPLRQRGTYGFRLTGDDVGVSRTLPYSFPDEHRFYPPDADLLAEIAAATGGSAGSNAAEIFSTDGESVVRPTPLWPYLAALGVLLYLTDLLLRRIRLFESHL